MEATPVHIVNEDGPRLVVSRDIERNAVTREVMAACWPEDECAQRMWCLTIASQARGTLAFRDPDEDALLEFAERLRNYVLHGPGGSE